MKLFVMPFVLLFISLYSISQEWNIIEIGTCPTVYSYDIIMDDGRNDGINRLYVSTRDGGVYEWTYNGGMWNYVEIIASIDNLGTLMIGDARNDGINRLYTGEWKGNNAQLFESYWDGANWVTTEIGVETKAITSVLIGDINGSTTNSLIVSGYYGTTEYVWNGSNWVTSTIDSFQFVEGPGCIGKGRNDTVNRLYLPGEQAREFSWNGSYYDSLKITGFNWPESSWLADGRNDGTQRLYVQDWSGSYECTWNGANWDTTLLSSILGRGEFYAGKTKSDGLTYIYSSVVMSDFREYNYNSTTQNYDAGVVVDAATGATSCIAIGDGRNDDTVRIYTPHYSNGGIYEITNIAPYVYNSTQTEQKEVPRFSVNIYPNPVNEYINITSSEVIKEIRLLDVSGKLISKFESNKKSFKVPSMELKSSVYYITVSTEKEKTTKKLIIN